MDSIGNCPVRRRTPNTRREVALEGEQSLIESFRIEEGLQLGAFFAIRFARSGI
jgi:hypothetical protein